VAVPCEVREEEQCRRLVERAVPERGRNDIPINNAAYQMSQPNGMAAIATGRFDRVVHTVPGEVAVITDICAGRSSFAEGPGALTAPVLGVRGEPSRWCRSVSPMGQAWR
jgi:NAD(P)-dependent dehydrogenase (short-subunit alcohol dehydrogenase family)